MQRSRKSASPPKGVDAALRIAGHASLEEGEAVVLETNGSLSVIDSKPDKGTPSALCQLRDFPNDN